MIRSNSKLNINDTYQSVATTPEQEVSTRYVVNLLETSRTGSRIFIKWNWNLNTDFGI